MKKRDMFVIGSGIVSTTFLIIFQKVPLIDIPLWFIWNLVMAGLVYQISKLFISKESTDLELKCHYIIQILSIIVSSYYVITHHSPEFEFRLILYNYFIFLISCFILSLVGLVIISLYGIISPVVQKNPPTKLKENGLLEYMNETQLRALLNESLKNEDYNEADKIQKILDKRFP